MSSPEKIFSKDGKPMLSARKAAARLGCAPDYISKLCREGKLLGEQVDGQWFIVPSSIAEFEASRLLAKQQRSQQLAEQRRNENLEYQTQHGSLTTRVFLHAKKISAGAPIGMAFGAALLFGALVFASSLQEPARNFSIGSGEPRESSASAYASEVVASVSEAQAPFFGTQPPAVTLPAHTGNAFAAATNFLSNIFSMLFGHQTQVAQNSPVAPSQVAPPANLAPSAPQNSPTSPAAPNAPVQTRPQTVVNNYPVIERTVTAGGVSESELTSRLQDLYNRFAVQISNLQNPGRESPLQNFVVPQVINNLSNVRLNGDTRADNISATYINSGRLDVSGDTNLSGALSAGTTTITGALTIAGAGGNTSLNAGTTTLTNLAVTNTSTSTFAGALASSVGDFLLSASQGGNLLFNPYGGNVGVGTTSPTSAFSVQGNQYTSGQAYFGGAVTATSTLAVSQLGTFSSGLLSLASTTVGDGTATGGLTVWGGATTTGNAYFAGGLGVGIATSAPGTLQVQNNGYFGGDLFVGGNSTTLGNSSSNTLTINSSINSSIVPNQNIQYDLGSPSFYWRNVYVGNIVANNISAASTTIAGTASATFTINSDNVSSDAEDMDLIFFRGNVVPNALLSWKSTPKRFEFNQPLFIQNNTTNTLSNITLDLKGEAGQTGALFNVASSTGTSVFNITSAGNVGVGTTSPWRTFSVSGTSDLGTNALAGSFTATSTTASSFAGGFTAFASSTIGNGTQAGGLTVNGGATTTGAVNILSGLGLTMNMSTTKVRFREALAADNVNLTTNLDPVASVQDNATKSSWSLRMGAFADDFNISRSPAGSAGLISFLTLSSVGSATIRGDVFAAGGVAGSAIGFANRTLMRSSADGLLSITNAAGTDFTRMQFGGTTSAFPALARSGTSLGVVAADGTLGASLGIGTTTPWAKFSINNNTNDTAGQPLFAIASSTATATSTVFVVTNSGNVGIGTASPLASLHVAGLGAVNKGIVAIQNTAGTAASGAGNGAGITFWGSDMGSGATGRVGYVSQDGSGSNIFRVSNDVNSDFILQTNAQERLRLNANESARGAVTIVDSASSNSSSLAAAISGYGSDIGSGSTGRSWYFGNDGGVQRLDVFYQQNAPMAFFTNATQQMTITGAGNVGIGTTSPSQTLDVNGSARLNGSSGGSPTFAGDSFALILGGPGNYRGRVAMTADAGIANYTSIFEGTTAKWTYGYGGSTNSNSFFVSRSTIGNADLTISSSGNVGIGTTTPGANLVVNGTTGQNLFQVATSTNQNVLTVTQNGLLGVNTGAPSFNADVNGTFGLGSKTDIGSQGTVLTVRVGSGGGSTAYFDFTRLSGANASYRMGQNGNNFIITNQASAGTDFSLSGAASAPTINIGSANGQSNGNLIINNSTGSGLTNTALTLSNNLTPAGNNIKLTFSSFDLTGNNASSTAEIVGVKTASANGFLTGDLAFNTNNAGTVSEKMRILGNGNVGIGTTSPYSMLSVAGQVVGQNFVATSTTATSTFAGDVKITSGNAGYTPFVVQGASSQTGALADFRDSSGNSLLSINPRITQSNANLFVVNASKQVIQGNLATFYGYVASTVDFHQSSDPGSGQALASPSLQLTGRTNPSGTVIDSSAAISFSPYTSGSGVLGTLDFSINNVEGLTMSRFENRKPSVYIGTTTTDGLAQFVIEPSFNGRKGEVIIAKTGQTANLFEAQDSNLNTLFNITGAGNVGIGTTTPGSTLSVAGNIFSSGFYDTSGTTGGYKIDGNLILQASSTNFSTRVGISAAPNLVAAATGDTAVGYQAMQNATTTSSNSAFGFQALIGDATNFTGGNNSAFGYQALRKITTGNDNVGVGVLALGGITTGQFNAALGSFAGSAFTGSRSVAIGYQTLSAAGSGSDNNALGYQAMLRNTTGANNNAFGETALQFNTTGSSNSAFGDFALSSNITGSFNTALGASALGGRNTTGSNNTVIGYGSFYFNTSATSSVAVGFQAGEGTGNYNNQGSALLGYQAGFNFTTGSDYNTLLGYQAGYGITSGSNNIWIGTATSSTGIANLTTGSQNILIGNNISLPSATASGQLNIGNILYGTGITGTGSTLSNGLIGIGTTTPGSALSVAGNAFFSGFYNTSGTTGGYKIDGSVVLQASSTNFSTLVGIGAGSSMNAAATGNTAVGYQAMLNATSSSVITNTALGYQALIGDATNFTGSRNTALGYQALRKVTTGSSNTGVGVGAFGNNTTGSFGVAIGDSALITNSTGANNNAIGYQALLSNSAGSDNNALGWNALQFNTGNNNIGIGSLALNANTSGGQNTAVGINVMQQNTTGTNNTAMGGNVFRFNTSATSSVGVGYQAGYGGVAYSNQGSALLGYQAGLNFQTGSDYNTLLGYGAGNLITTGSKNIVLGAASTLSNSNLTTGSNNIIIGNDVQAPSATASNQLNIGNLLFGTGLSGTGSTIAGNIGIGTTTPTALLSLPDNTSSTGGIRFGSDLALYRNGTGGSLVVDAFNGGTNPRLRFAESGTVKANFETLSGDLYISTAGANPIFLRTNNTEVMRLTAGGLVGIGSTTPWAQFSINPNGIGTGPEFAIGSSTKTHFVVTNTGNVGVGTTTPYAKFSVHANNGETNTTLFSIASSTASATATLFSVNNQGAANISNSLGIGIITTNALSVNGTTYISNLPADNSGLYVCWGQAGGVQAQLTSGSACNVSSQKVKNSITPLSLSTTTTGLSAILQLNPVTFRYIQGFGDSGSTTQTGLIAEQVAQVNPLFAEYATNPLPTPNGTIEVGQPNGVNWYAITDSLVLAVQDLHGTLEPLSATSTASDLAASSTSSIVDGFSSTLHSAVAGLGAMVTRVFNGAISATVGIFNKVYTKEVHADKLCVSDNTGETCITKSQLDSLLSGASQNGGTATSTGSGAGGTATSTPPTITLIGADPAQLKVGDTYMDPGVTVTSTLSPNIGYTMSLDGATSTLPSNFHLDTSTSSTHIILYSATDQAGQTGTATRTVIVQ